MNELKTPKNHYCVPDCWDGDMLPGILCQSLADGSLEDLTEEDWTI